jgi:hypothetical protein
MKICNNPDFTIGKVAMIKEFGNPWSKCQSGAVIRFAGGWGFLCNVLRMQI